MQVKVYLVIEVVKPGSEKVIAARLNHSSAREVARQKPNRSVRLMIATKELHLSAKEKSEQHK